MCIGERSMAVFSGGFRPCSPHDSQTPREDKNSNVRPMSHRLQTDLQRRLLHGEEKGSVPYTLRAIRDIRAGDRAAPRSTKKPGGNPPQSAVVPQSHGGLGTDPQDSPGAAAGTTDRAGTEAQFLTGAKRQSLTPQTCRPSPPHAIHPPPPRALL